jgi:Calx-beta domain/Bacterial Ig-like domain
VTEGIDSAAFFTVRLSRASLQPVNVNFDTADDTAIASEYYEATHMPLTILPGSTQANVPVGIIDDTQHEDLETFKVSVFSTDTANGGGIGVGTILDNDPLPPPRDTKAPTVTTTNPQDGARDVLRTTTVTANFSEAVQGVGPPPSSWSR